MGDIDKISETLGALQADMASSQRQRSEIFRMIEGVNKSLAQISTDLALLRKVYEEHSSKIVGLRKDVDAVSANVGALQLTKTKALAVVGAVAVVGTAISRGGEAMLNGLHKLLGGN